MNKKLIERAADLANRQVFGVSTANPRFVIRHEGLVETYRNDDATTLVDWLAAAPEIIAAFEAAYKQTAEAQEAVAGWLVDWPENVGENSGCIRNRGPEWEKMARARQYQGATITPLYTRPAPSSAARIAALEQECAGLRKDAKRYLWLTGEDGRMEFGVQCSDRKKCYWLIQFTRAEANDRIDAAISNQPQRK